LHFTSLHFTSPHLTHFTSPTSPFFYFLFSPPFFVVIILEIIAKSGDEILKLIQSGSDFIIYENITELELAGTFSTHHFSFPSLF